MFKHYLIQTIHTYYDFLFKEFDFQDFLITEDERNVSGYYIKKNFVVKINYNLPNKYLDIDFYRETDIAKLSGDEMIDLPLIMKDKNPDFEYYRDYDFIMPGYIPLDESLKLLSELVKKYCPSYLSGREWKTWKDVR
jgi:hypothetical protein